MSPHARNESKVAIIACASLAREMKSVAEEHPIPFVLKVIDAACHRDPNRLRNTIDSYVSPLFSEGFKIFIAYGNCCTYINLDPKNIYHIEALNCAAILLGGEQEYLKNANKAYFLTPYLARNWKEYFLGKPKDFVPDEKTARSLKKWFTSIDKIIKIKVNSSDHDDENELAKQFANLIGKPLVFIKGSLDLLREEYNIFISIIAKS
jgi:hypothetical protein